MKKSPKIICISGKARHGKDTTANFIEEELTSQGYKVLLTHYADLLKWMCVNYFGWNGEKDEAGRTLLQRVGTDVIREQDPEFWVKWVVKVLQLFEKEWDYVIIPDCRFPNEIREMERRFPTYHLRVQRPGFTSNLSEEQQQHPSEIALDNTPFDFAVVNNGSIEDLKEYIKQLIPQLL